MGPAIIFGHVGDLCYLRVMGTKVKVILTTIVVLLTLYACRNDETTQISRASFEDLSKEGYIQCRKGNYLEGMTLLLAAKDSLAHMCPDSINRTTEVMLLGNIANMYTRMGLFEEAKMTNSKAMALAETSSPRKLPDLWCMRAIIYERTGQIDSAIICNHIGIELCDRIDNDNSRRRLKDRATENMLWRYVEYPGYAPDSLRVVKDRLEQIVAQDSTAYSADTNRFIIGRAYVLLGDYSRGLSMMEKSLESFRKNGDTESVEWGLQLLAKSYAAARDRRLLDIYAEAADMHDTIMLRQREDLLLGMDFKYRTSRLRQENEILQGQLREKRQKIVFITLIGVLAVISLITFTVMYHRNNKKQLRLKQQNIDTLLAERIALNARIEEMNQALTDPDAETRQQAVLKTILLEKEDEQRFRKTFNDLHPGFIDCLRREYPELTSGNELLCMLIALNRRNEEIALALGISRESVATSRYRLRNRFNLPKNIGLNDFLQSRL